jgi:hypothetical protein
VPFRRMRWSFRLTDSQPPRWPATDTTTDPPTAWVVAPSPPLSRMFWIALAGIPVFAALAFGTVRLVGAAWQACGDLEPGGAGALLVLFLPLTTGLAWLVTLPILWATRRRWSVVGAAVALVAGTLVCVVVASALVPAYGEDDPIYNSVEMTPECGPRGIPTWWPAWLPS